MVCKYRVARQLFHITAWPLSWTREQECALPPKTQIVWKTRAGFTVSSERADMGPWHEVRRLPLPFGLTDPNQQGRGLVMTLTIEGCVMN